MAAKKVSALKVTPSKEMDKWEIESALSTLRRADEIRKNPSMMTKVKSLAQEQIKALGGVVGGTAKPVRTLKRK
jgi:hypothetical protein